MVNIFELRFPDASEMEYPAILLSKCQHYHSINPLYSYCCGLFCIQVALISQTQNNNTANVLSKLLQHLERVKPSLNLSFNEKTSNFVLRKTLGFELNKKYDHYVKIIWHLTTNSEKINFGQMVNLLLDLAFMYQVLVGLFPLKDFQISEQHQLIEFTGDDGDIEYKIHFCKTQANTILSIIKSGQDPHDYIEQLKLIPFKQIQDPTINPTTKQLDDMITRVLEIPDEELKLAMESDQDSNLGLGYGNMNKGKNSHVDEQLSNKSDNSKSLMKQQLGQEFDVTKTVTDLDKLPSIIGASDCDTVPEAQPNSLDYDGDEKQYNNVEIGSSKEITSNHKDSISQPKSATNDLHFQNKHRYTTQELNNMLQGEDLLQKSIKEAKFAISALNYEDTDTALAKLQTAIDLIHQYRRNI